MGTIQPQGIIDDSMKMSGINAILGAIAHDIAHRVGWEGPGYSLISDWEADNIVIERGLWSYLLETKSLGRIKARSCH